ncbi:hypothetical protein MXD63_41365, partial [Frankia sp. Cpl3]|nr:hypothetical protein [Frankia sp. Cpl3]
MIAENHPQLLGGLGEGGSKAGLQALHEADLLVILGASWFPRSYLPQGIPIIQVDENPEAFHHVPALVPVLAQLAETLPFWLQRLEQHQSDQLWKKRMEQLHRMFLLETEQL